jgi:hypothetical protein
MSLSKWEQRSRRSTVNITFLITSEGHEAICKPWILFFWMSGFFTRPDSNSHSHSLVWDFCPSSLEFSHKARCWLIHAQTQSGLRLLPQFLGAFSQSQVPTHTGTGTVWFWGFCSGSLGFLTRPGTHSHRQGPIAGSDNSSLFIF